MIAQLHAVAVRADLSDLDEHLSPERLEALVLPPPARPGPGTQVTDAAERRAELLADYAGRLLERGEYGRVRQRAVFSSLSLPPNDPDEEAWTRADGPAPRTPEHRRLLREERRKL